MPIQKLRSGMRMRRHDGPSKRHIIRNNASKESNRIARKNNTGRTIRVVAAEARAVVPEDKVVVGIKTLLTSVSSLVHSHLSSLHQNQKSSQMKINQRSNLLLEMAVMAKQATDRSHMYNRIALIEK